MVRGRSRVVVPIITEKHYTNNSLETVAIATINNHVAVSSVPLLSKNTSVEVEEGNLVKAIYVERWLTSDDATQTTFNLTVEKVPSQAPVMTFANSQALNTYSNKKNILYTTQGLANPTTGVAMPVIKQWIAIPKGKQRMGFGDRILVNIAAITDGVNFCGLDIFKEWK